MNLPAESISQPIRLRHGGDLTEALKIYGGNELDWLDLSTGISPWSYPIPAINDSLWQSLPNKPDNLLSAAAHYYNCEISSLTISPGSQLAIRLVPTLVSSNQSVAVPYIGYQEHARSWQLAGHRVIPYHSLVELNQLIKAKKVDNVIVINPNNPSCDAISAEQIRSIAAQIPGLMIVDEAFADLDPSNSLSSDSALNNTVIFRSIGKFFGLAGARVGFVITHNPIGLKLSTLLEPWGINAPAQYLAELALRDYTWQGRQRFKIGSQAIDLKEQLKIINNQSRQYFKLSSAGLFTTLSGRQSKIIKLHRQLAQDRIWTRIGDPYSSVTEPETLQNWLRISLPGNNFDTLIKSLNRAA